VKIRGAGGITVLGLRRHRIGGDERDQQAEQDHGGKHGAASITESRVAALIDKPDAGH